MEDMSQISRLVSRRGFLKLAGVSITLAAATGSVLWYPQPAQAAIAQPNREPDSPDAALQRLLNGNKRFMQQKPEYPHHSQARLQEVATAQHPFATLLSCADSRVPAEIVFDQGLGDLFDVRIAGNIVTNEALGSLEYAAVLLGTPLIMVLGHERCGAVTAAVQNQPLPGQISSFAKAIKPVVAEVKDKLGDLVENAVVANVQYQVTKLKQSELLTKLVEEGNLKIVGGRYDLDTGQVTIVT